MLVHAQGADGNTGRDFNGPWMRSIEAQIIEGGVGDIILVAGFEADGTRLTPRLSARVGKDRDGETVFDPNGETREFESGRINWFGRDPDWQDKLGFRGKADVESPVGEWTRLEVVAQGDRLTYAVNGKVVNEGFRSSLTEGKILIQCEGAEIFFRRDRPRAAGEVTGEEVRRQRAVERPAEARGARHDTSQRALVSTASYANCAKLIFGS